MRQLQRQTQSQKLALTQTMRTSLALLEMGPEELAEAIEREQSRNAFLFAFPSEGSGRGGDNDAFENVSKESELDVIARQIGLIRLSSRQAELAHGVLHSLDDRGFLSDNLKEVVQYLGCTMNELAKLLPILQKNIEPVGLFATSLVACFRLQLEEKNRLDPLIEALLGRLDLIAKQDVVAICAEFDIDAEDATDMLEDIRGLNPAPMRQTPEIAEVQSAPELIIKQTTTGDLKAELNEAALPRVLTDDALFSSTMAAETDGYAQMYYRDCYQGAGNMVRAMQKRANTLLATGSTIAKQQKKFIRTGRDRDKLPLTIEQLASEVGVNKSTVSRALKSCSIMTDRGTYQAHEFLARALTSEGQHNKTRDQAPRRLALLVKTENPRQPSSDEQLAQQLDNLNFTISRRTVAKYRKLLDIPGMHSRRKP